METEIHQRKNNESVNGNGNTKIPLSGNAPVCGLVFPVSC